jgi:predicted nucleic acid-binding protein
MTFGPVARCGRSRTILAGGYNVTMRVYLDMCCLKRPFDDQSQPRVRLEAEAVLSLLAAESATLEFIRSTALLLENKQNPILLRAARVDLWLKQKPSAPVDPGMLRSRTDELMACGLAGFDALHIACAELSGADAFATCDDRLRKAAERCGRVRVRIVGAAKLAEEVLA